MLTKWTQKTIKRWIKENRKDLKFIKFEFFNNFRSVIIVKCIICCNVYKLAFCSILQGNNCNKCKSGRHGTWSEKRIIKWIKINRPQFKFIKILNFKFIQSKILLTCKNDNYNFEIKFSNLFVQTGCIKCSIGRFEKKVINSFKIIIKEFYNLKYIKEEYQKKFINLKGINNGYLRFDYYCKIGDKEFCLEAQGKQHYDKNSFFNIIGKQNSDISFKTLQKNDLKKRNYCKKNNIILIEVPYYKKNIDNFLRTMVSSNI